MALTASLTIDPMPRAHSFGKQPIVAGWPLPELA